MKIHHKLNSLLYTEQVTHPPSLPLLSSLIQQTLFNSGQLNDHCDFQMVISGKEFSFHGYHNFQYD